MGSRIGLPFALGAAPLSAPPDAMSVAPLPAPLPAQMPVPDAPPSAPLPAMLFGLMPAAGLVFVLANDSLPMIYNVCDILC
jgi:hypothetical protein